jgi:phosphotransferase system IIA component
MKSVGFKKKGAPIRVIKEKTKKKKVNWDKLIYLAFLLTILYFLGKYLLGSYLYIEGEGHVLFKKLDIQHTSPIRIVEFYKESGDEVQIGDSLYTFIDEDKVRDHARVSSGSFTFDNRNWVIKERLKQMKELNLKQIELQGAYRELKTQKAAAARIRKEVYLDVYSVDKLNPYLRKISDLETTIGMLLREIEYLKKFIDGLKYVSFAENEMGDGGVEDFKSVKFSPINGTITQINKENYEVALESEIVLSIHKPENIYIKGFFKQEDIKHIKEGDVVDVEFPDGTMGQGRIEQFYFATYRLPAEFQAKHEPAQRRVAADVVPLTKKEIKKWQSFYKLNVKLSKQISVE